LTLKKNNEARNKTQDFLNEVVEINDNLLIKLQKTEDRERRKLKEREDKIRGNLLRPTASTMGKNVNITPRKLREKINKSPYKTRDYELKTKITPRRVNKFKKRSDSLTKNIDASPSSRLRNTKFMRRS